MLGLSLLASLAAHAGSSPQPYGVPDKAGSFSYESRDLMTWVNAFRVAPTAWDDFLKWASYDVDGCSSDEFTADERLGHAPLAHDLSLMDIALAHSMDMAATGVASHDSSNGQTMDDRIGGVYGDAFAEAIGMGHDTGFSMVANGWVCDPDARAALLAGAYNEAGIGITSGYFTADFGAGQIETTSPVVNASHMVDFERANGNPWYFIAPVTGGGGC